MNLRIGLWVAILALVAVPVFSANMVVNPSFEDPSYLGNSAIWGLTTIGSPGWYVWGPVGTETVGVISNTYSEGPFGGPGTPNPGPLQFTAADGSQHVDMTGQGNVGGVFLIQEIPTAVGQWYTIRFSLGNLGYGGNSTVCTNAACTATEDNYADSARIYLVVGDGTNNVVTTYNNALSGTGRQVVWQSMSYTFQAASTNTMLAFANGRWDRTDNYVGLDNVSMDVAGLPEPGTVAMMGCGLLALGLLRTRFRKN